MTPQHDHTERILCLQLTLANERKQHRARLLELELELELEQALTSLIDVGAST